ncbi:MAG: deoxyribose-phosphate aldolase [Clostridiales bacterium]|nr:deoxyribose-phosphate aldolase [Clostridiales bacterium]
MNIAKTIDHTLLKPEATAADIQALCREAKQYGFASVCVNTCYVRLASELLRGSGVKVCCTVGFPLGAMAPKAKAFEAAQAVADGAEEVDMVLWIGALRQGNTAAVQADIEGVVNACHPRAIVKVILETCLLTDAQIETACRLCVAAGADYVKTSTGFSTAGATAEHVALMKRAVGGRAKVKAAGGIRTYEDAKRMIDAGADRIGASAGIAIVEAAEQRGEQ